MCIDSRFAPSSADAHGEWAHLDRYALSRCVNPTHRFRRVPRKENVPSIQPAVVESMIDLAHQIVERYCEQIGNAPATRSEVAAGAVGGETRGGFLESPDAGEPKTQSGGT